MEKDINLSQAKVKALIIHRVGNKFRDEGILISENESERNEKLDNLLLNKFLIPVIKSDEEYILTHESDIALNVLKNFSSIIFKDNGKFYASSVAIAKHLYSCSTHPNIAEGEFIEILFDGIIINDSTYQAVGLFKVETKSQFLDVKNHKGVIDMVEKTGISLDTIQKGAIILSLEDSVYVVDNLSKKTKYWIDNFIKGTPRDTPKKYTKVFGEIVKAVSKKIEEPNNMLKFSENLSNKDDFSINEIKEISSNFIREEEFDSILKGAEVKHSMTFKNDFRLDRNEIKKYIKETVSRTRISNGVNIVISEPNTKLLSVEIESTNEGYRAILEIQNGE